MDSRPPSALDERHKAWQRTASRRKKRSKRQAKARRYAARIAAKAARKRLHWQHVTTTRMARRFATAILEDLKIRNMSASAKGTAEEPGKKRRAEGRTQPLDPRGGVVPLRTAALLQASLPRRQPREGRSAIHVRDLLRMRVEGQGNPRKPSEVPLPLLRTRRPCRRQRGGQHPGGRNTAIEGG
ncbi:transposase [Rhizobium sp. 007]|nr:transposase [Rhizobium sp. 007]